MDRRRLGGQIVLPGRADLPLQVVKGLALGPPGAGLRQGEAFGLALDRISSVTGMITIDQQVIIVDRRPVLAPPKTSSSLRDVPMPAFVLAAVAEHCSRLGLPEDTTFHDLNGHLVPEASGRARDAPG